MDNNKIIVHFLLSVFFFLLSFSFLYRITIHSSIYLSIYFSISIHLSIYPPYSVFLLSLHAYATSTIKFSHSSSTYQTFSKSSYQSCLNLHYKQITIFLNEKKIFVYFFLCFLIIIIIIIFNFFLFFFR